MEKQPKFTKKIQLKINTQYSFGGVTPVLPLPFFSPPFLSEGLTPLFKDLISTATAWGEGGTQNGFREHMQMNHAQVKYTHNTHRTCFKNSYLSKNYTLFTCPSQLPPAGN